MGWAYTNVIQTLDGDIVVNESRRYLTISEIINLTAWILQKSIGWTAKTSALRALSPFLFRLDSYSTRILHTFSSASRSCISLSSQDEGGGKVQPKFDRFSFTFESITIRLLGFSIILKPLLLNFWVFSDVFF